MVRSVIYVVSDQSTVLGRRLGPAHGVGARARVPTASTLLGVAALGYGGQLVEVDLTAALEG